MSERTVGREEIEESDELVGWRRARALATKGRAEA